MKKLLAMLTTITSLSSITPIVLANASAKIPENKIINNEINSLQTSNLEKLKRKKRENNEKIENWFCFSCPNRLVLKIKHQTWSFLKDVQKILSKDKFNKLVFSIIKYFTKINKSADIRGSNYISDDDINILVDVIAENFDDINIVFENKNNDNIGLFIRTNRKKYWENNDKSSGFWGAYPNVNELKQDAASYHNEERTKFFSKGLAALALLSVIILSEGALAPVVMPELEILGGEALSEGAVMFLEESSEEIEVFEMEEFSQSPLEEEAEELETDVIRQRIPWSQRNIDTIEIDVPSSSTQTTTQWAGDILEEETTNSSGRISINSLDNIINRTTALAPLATIMNNNLGSSPIASSSSIDIILSSSAEEETETNQTIPLQDYRLLFLNGTEIYGGTRQLGRFWCGPAVAEAALRYIAHHNNSAFLNNITSWQLQENLARNFLNTDDDIGTAPFNFINGINNYITQNRISTNQYQLVPIEWQSDMITMNNFIHSSISLSLQNNMPVIIGYFGSQNINEDDDHSHFIVINGFFSNYTADMYPNETTYTYMDPGTGEFGSIDSSHLVSYFSPNAATIRRVNGLDENQDLEIVAANLVSGYIIYSWQNPQPQ